MQRFLAILSIIIISGCAQVPITGRTQLSLVSNSEIMALSSDEYQKVLNSSEILHTGEYAQMVKSVGQSIQASVELYMNDNGYSDRLDGFNW